MLEKVGNKGNYLNYKELSPKQTLRKVARLHSASVRSSSETHTHYLIMHLRDINNVHVMASMFQIEDPSDVSVKMKMMKGNLIEITGVVGVFGGKYTINVTSPENIQLHIDEDAEKVFSRKIDNVTELQEEMTQTYAALGLDLTHSVTYEFKGADNVYDGKAGGIIKLMNDVIRSSSAYFRAVGIDSELFGKCLYVALEVVAQKLVTESSVGFTDNYGIFNKINSYQGDKLFDEITFPVAFDVMTSVTGLTEPVHPYALIIKKIIDTSLQVQEIVSAVPTLVLGTSAVVGGTKISAF